MLRKNVLKTVASALIVITLLPSIPWSGHTSFIPPTGTEQTNEPGIMPMNDLPPRLN